jgi:SAM-dependent methyltransferase|tara:strand:- start:1080 stop:2033 length:954 start_codon:yes stop_codon:yes gene_type:complete
MDETELEAQAFDDQIRERVKNGHIPDLREVKPCDYFYNNPWRRPELVQLDMGESFQLILKSIQNYSKSSPKDTKVLEVGCGPGYMSLELARYQYQVTGLDLSSACLDLARELSQNDPHRDNKDNLRYLKANFTDPDTLKDEKFDVVLFFGSLHHFAKQDHVMEKALHLLNSEGLVVAHEPARDRYDEGNVALSHLVRTLLSATGSFYKESAVPSSKKLNHELEALMAELKYEDEGGTGVQSVNDNEAGFDEMYDALSKNFTELHFEDRYAFFHEIIGGIRLNDEKNIQLARYLRDIDAILCKKGVVKATEFFYIGSK